jgi:hypothetical protein
MLKAPLSSQRKRWATHSIRTVWRFMGRDRHVRLPTVVLRLNPVLLSPG